jgi:lysozyme family protein
MGHDFETIIGGTVVDEGGIVTWTKLPSDDGGETIGGVSKVHNKGLGLWDSMDFLKTATGDFGRGVTGPIDLSTYASKYPGVVRNIHEDVVEVYEEKGWLHKGLGSHVRDVGSLSVACKLFNARYFTGTSMWGAVTRFVQAAVGASVDGIFGPGTLAALNAHLLGEPTGDPVVDAINTVNREWEMLVGIYSRMVEFNVTSGQRATRIELRRLHDIATVYDGMPEAEKQEYVDDSYDRTKQINMLGWVRRAASGVVT